MQRVTIPQIQVRTHVRSGASQGGGYVNGVWYSDQSGICGSSGTTPPSTPPTPTPPVQPPTSGGGWVAGVWYPDKSGVCG